MSKEFTKHTPRIKAWACVDSESGVMGVYGTREEARNQKRHAEYFGHKQKVAKLVFEEFVR